MAEGFIGEIRMFAGNFAPRSWAFCNGQLQSIAENSALFSILGTTYGGDGRTTFGLPDLRGRAPISPGNGPGLPSYRLGEQGGTPTSTLNVTNIPPHTHATSVGVNTGEAGESNPQNQFLGAANVYAESATAGASLGGVAVGNSGGGQSFNNMQPYTAINYIIALFGTYPSRS
jgi:microcystin-dependent protein